MNYLSDVINYVRRLIKTPSNAVVSDSLIVDYINRFWLYDVDPEMQLFDLKTVYRFQTQPGIDKYNMPLYQAQSSALQSEIASFPVYQGFMAPAKINGVNANFYTERDQFYNLWPTYVQNFQAVAIGTGDPSTLYTFTIPYGMGPASVNQPVSGLLRGHVDMVGIIASGSSSDPILTNNFNTGVPVTSVYSAITISTLDATGANMIIQDSGQFLSSNVNYGLLMSPGQAPFGNQPLSQGYSTLYNTVNYNTGVINVYFPEAVPQGQNINLQCYFYQPGLPRSILFYNNCLTLRSLPYTQYTVELAAYLTPAAFLSSGAVLPFGYMSEYLSLGAARKLLSDTGDQAQADYYERRFIEQQHKVWIRSQRIKTATRTPTIYSGGTLGNTVGGNASYGNGV